MLDLSYSVSGEDSGVYFCVASNGYEPVGNVSATLTVLGEYLMKQMVTDIHHRTEFFKLKLKNIFSI